MKNVQHCPLNMLSLHSNLTALPPPTGPFSFPFLGSPQQGKLINTIVHRELEKLGDQYGDLIFFRLLMDQPLLIVRGFDFVNVRI